MNAVGIVGAASVGAAAGIAAWAVLHEDFAALWVYMAAGAFLFAMAAATGMRWTDEDEDA